MGTTPLKVRMVSPVTPQNKLVKGGLNKDNFAAFGNINNGRPVAGANPRSPMAVPTSQSSRTPLITNLSQHVTLTSIPSQKFVSPQAFSSLAINSPKLDSPKTRNVMAIKTSNLLQEFQEYQVEATDGYVHLFILPLYGVNPK